MKAEIIGINGRLTKNKEFFNARDHHMLGTPYENLIEAAGRICYDSFTGEKTRNSVDYHKHILESRHTSVLAHSMVFGYLSEAQAKSWAWNFRNYRGWNISDLSPVAFILSANIRLLEYVNRIPQGGYYEKETENVLYSLLFQAYKIAPLIFGEEIPPKIKDRENYVHGVNSDANTLNAPYNSYWISMKLSDVSRSFSHEFIRHDSERALSQRSTRYVDESESNFIVHPFDNTPKSMRDSYWNSCTSFYRDVFEKSRLELISKGVDGFDAKKQARGIAMRYMPHGLETEFIFTATLRQWGEIIAQRVSGAADGEIRQCEMIRQQLKTIPDLDMFEGKFPRMNIW